jgi:hypothetical protein
MQRSTACTHPLLSPPSSLCCCSPALFPFPFPVWRQGQLACELPFSVAAPSSAPSQRATASYAPATLQSTRWRWQTGWHAPPEPDCQSHAALGGFKLALSMPQAEKLQQKTLAKLTRVWLTTQGCSCRRLCWALFCRPRAIDGYFRYKSASSKQALTSADKCSDRLRTCVRSTVLPSACAGVQ